MEDSIWHWCGLGFVFSSVFPTEGFPFLERAAGGVELGLTSAGGGVALGLTSAADSLAFCFCFMAVTTGGDTAVPAAPAAALPAILLALLLTPVPGVTSSACMAVCPCWSLSHSVYLTV